MKLPEGIEKKTDKTISDDKNKNKKWYNSYTYTYMCMYL